VVRKAGSNAGKVLSEGVAASTAAGKPRLTQKTLAKLGTSVVKAAVKASETTADHLERMLESPTFTRDTKAAVQIVIDAIGGKQPPKRSGDNVSAGGLTWLDGLRNHKNPLIKPAAEYLSAMLAVAAGNRTAMSTVPPSIMTLEDAIRTEMESQGELMAEVMCPEHSALIVYLRAAQQLTV
jgi:hypothetical protein